MNSDASALVKNLRHTRAQISSHVNARLVAVGKTKPAEMVRELYLQGNQRHFGENYVQELVEKSRSLHSDCPDIKWHFIGHLQSNKVGTLLRAHNLYIVETVDRVKIARKLNEEIAKRAKKEVGSVDADTNAALEGSIVGGERLRVMVQVNTSGEKNKNGVTPGKDLLELVQFIREQCPYLEFTGLMTIGALARSVQSQSKDGANEDFALLVQCRKEVCEKVLHSDNVDSVELSMGMSNDYLSALEYGSTNIRVGSTIFGPRDLSKIPKE